MKERQPGFYWVRRKRVSEWEIAQWMGQFWLETGFEPEVKDEAYSEIDEKQIERKVS